MFLLAAAAPAPAADAVPARGLSRKRGRWAVWVDGDPEERVALDLSPGGLFLAGIAAPPGTRLRLTLVLGPDDADRLSLGAIVRWSRQGRLVPRALRGVGLAFDGLDDPTRARLVAELERP